MVGQIRFPGASVPLEQNHDVHDKKSTVGPRLDDSVARFYCAKGNKSYRALVNRVLATYTHLKISNVRVFEVFRAEKAREERERRNEEARAEWGDD